MNAIAVRCALGAATRTPPPASSARHPSRTLRLRITAGIRGPHWVEQQSAMRAAIGDEAFDAAYADSAAIKAARQHGTATAGDDCLAHGEVDAGHGLGVPIALRG